jgi:hypothetical protein
MKFDEEHFTRQEQALGFLETARVHLLERDGGAWLDWEGGGTIHVAILDPTPEDLRLLTADVANLPWSVAIVAVNHSREQLVGLVEELSNADLPSTEPDSWVSLGWSPIHNAVVATLRRVDQAAIDWLKEHVPADALRVEIRPSAGRAYAPNATNRTGVAEIIER